MPAGDDEQAKAKQQGMAQSFVSLGNLEIERGDAAVAEAASDDRLPPGAARQAGATFYLAARMHMEAARDAYVHGFSSSHPKVAWALEGLAKIHEKCGDLGAALETYRQALHMHGVISWLAHTVGVCLVHAAWVHVLAWCMLGACLVDARSVERAC